MADWGDLRRRLGSGLAMALVFALAVWAGGLWFAALIAAASAVMMWELARLTAPDRPIEAVLIAVLSAAVLIPVFVTHHPMLLPLLVLPPLLGAAQPRRLRWVFFAYAFAVMLAAYALVGLRQGMGLATLIWLVGLVVASDILGYFVGRSLGGPKFWPAISPKKTWSGTVAGWVGAAGVGLLFLIAGKAGWDLVLLSPLVGFAGQMGDIAESWIKRRVGVKDSSHLIPGHGGVLDRFDAVVAAAVFLLAWRLVAPLPVVGG